MRQRLYRGHCRPQTSIDVRLNGFREARADIVALFQDDQRLDATKDETIEYLDAFYAIIDQPANRGARCRIELPVSRSSPNQPAMTRLTRGCIR